MVSTKYRKRSNKRPEELVQVSDGQKGGGVN